MKFFLDNNLSPRLARALDALVAENGEVTHLRDKFSADTPDIEWLEGLANEGGWIVISGDLRITRNAHERRVWQQSRLTAFFLKRAWMNQDFWLHASRLIGWFPDILAQARKVEPGAGFLVPFRYSGKFEQPKLL